MKRGTRKPRDGDRGSGGTKSPGGSATLDALRERIDQLDVSLVELLSARAACALEIGRVKKVLGLEIYQPSREAAVLEHVQRINPGPLDDASIKRLFERIIDEARRLERQAEAREKHGGDTSLHD